jgi:hypothetical protein
MTRKDAETIKAWLEGRKESCMRNVAKYATPCHENLEFVQGELKRTFAFQTALNAINLEIDLGKHNDTEDQQERT